MSAIHVASAEYLKNVKNEKLEHWRKVNVTRYDFRSQQHVNATLPLAYCYSAL